MRVLNLYAGIGGNRKYWADCEVTACRGWSMGLGRARMDHGPWADSCVR